jgi:hypothetical protein
MWRTNLAGEFYTYLPPYTDPRFTANNAQCTAPNAFCDPIYGASIGTGLFYFKTGQWTTVSQRVRLNTVSASGDPVADGELELFADGVSVVTVTGLIIRDGALGRIRGIMAQTFFGGMSILLSSMDVS